MRGVRGNVSRKKSAASSEQTNDGNDGNEACEYLQEESRGGSCRNSRERRRCWNSLTAAWLRVNSERHAFRKKSQ